MYKLSEKRTCKKRIDEKYIDYVQEIEQSFAEQMQRELNLVYSGNRRMMHEKIEEMGLQFNAYRRATIEEARALHLLVMDRFVQAINAHEKIQPFLEVHPFTYKRVSISIKFLGINGPYCDETVQYTSNVPETASAIENRNNIFYDFLDPFKMGSINSLQEPYEEAVRLNEAVPLQNPAVHRATAQEEAVDQVLDAFTKEMKKRFGMECWYIGGKMANGVEEIGSTFAIILQANKEKARQLGVIVIEKLLEAINSDEKLRPFLIEYPFPSHRLRIRINLRDNQGYTYRDGSMESVTLDGDEMTYFHRPSVKDGIHPAEAPVFAKESYRDALESIKSTALE